MTNDLILRVEVSAEPPLWVKLFEAEHPDWKFHARLWAHEQRESKAEIHPLDERREQ